MIVNIGPEWRLESDELQWKLMKLSKGKKRDGTPWSKWVVEGYYRELDHVLIEAVRRRVLSWPLEEGPPASDALLSCLDELKRDIHDAIKQGTPPNE